MFVNPMAISTKIKRLKYNELKNLHEGSSAVQRRHVVIRRRATKLIRVHNYMIIQLVIDITIRSDFRSFHYLYLFFIIIFSATGIFSISEPYWISV